MSSNYKHLPELGIVSLNSSDPAVVLTPNSQNRTVQVGLDSSKITAAGSAAVVKTYTAGETISALKAVYVNPLDGKIYRASSSTLQSASVIGITKTAVNQDGTVELIQYGIFQDGFFGFDPAELIVLGDNGALTATPPASGYLTRLGRSINGNTILILVETPVQL